IELAPSPSCARSPNGGFRQTSRSQFEKPHEPSPSLQDVGPPRHRHYSPPWRRLARNLPQTPPQGGRARTEHGPGNESPRLPGASYGADDGVRTRDPQLGKPPPPPHEQTRTRFPPRKHRARDQDRGPAVAGDTIPLGAERSESSAFANP